MSSLKKKLTSSFNDSALAFPYIFSDDIFPKYWLNIYFVNIFLNVFGSKKSIRMSCRILQLFTMDYVPFVGDASSFISGKLWEILLLRIAYNFLVVVSAWSSMSL